MAAAHVGCVSKYLGAGSARIEAFWELAEMTTRPLVPGEQSDKTHVGSEADLYRGGSAGTHGSLSPALPVSSQARSLSQIRWWPVLSAGPSAGPPRNPSPSAVRDFVSALFVPPCFLFKRKHCWQCLCSCKARIHINQAGVYIPPGTGSCISTFCKTLSKTALAAGNGFFFTPDCFTARILPSTGGS